MEVDAREQTSVISLLEYLGLPDIREQWPELEGLLMTFLLLLSCAIR